MTTVDTLRTFSIEHLPPCPLWCDPRNARKHSQRQIARLRVRISEFSFTNPTLIIDRLNVIVGHRSLKAANALGLEHVPYIRLEELSEAQKRGLIADKAANTSQFYPEPPTRQLTELWALSFPAAPSAFDTAEDSILLKPPALDTATERGQRLEADHA